MAFVPSISYLVCFMLFQRFHDIQQRTPVWLKNICNLSSQKHVSNLLSKKVAGLRGREMANSSILPDVWVWRQPVLFASWNIIGFGKG